MIEANVISLSLNAMETVAIMHAIVLRMGQIPEQNEEFLALNSIVEKLIPHIERKAAQQQQYRQDDLN
jgi:hypothetical protein